MLPPARPRRRFRPTLLAELATRGAVPPPDTHRLRRVSPSLAGTQAHAPTRRLAGRRAGRPADRPHASTMPPCLPAVVGPTPHVRAAQETPQPAVCMHVPTYWSRCGLLKRQGAVAAVIGERPTWKHTLDQAPSPQSGRPSGHRRTPPPSSLGGDLWGNDLSGSSHRIQEQSPNS